MPLVKQSTQKKKPPLCQSSYSPSLSDRSPSNPLLQIGNFCKNTLQSPNLQYNHKKKVPFLTAYKYYNAQGQCISQRLMVSQLVFKNKRSPKMPVLIVTLDGGLGFLAENERCYYVRQSVVNLLAALSCNFKIIAVSAMRKKMVRKICGQLAERNGERSGIIFDGVYKHYPNVLSKQKMAGNWSHALLDFYDEEMELEDWCEKKLVCLVPECLDSNENEALKPF